MTCLHIPTGQTSILATGRRVVHCLHAYKGTIGAHINADSTCSLVAYRVIAVIVLRSNGLLAARTD